MKTLDRLGLVTGRDHTLGTLMERLARVHSSRRLVEEPDDGLCLTYAQASKRVNRWAGGIAAQIEPGEPVVIATGNGYEMLLLCLAASRAGGIPVPLNDTMREDEVAHVVGDSGAQLVVRSAVEVDGTAPLRDAVPAGPGDVAALFYTSGTTGRPKGAALTHAGILGQMAASALWPARLRRDEAVISLPVAHIMGFISLLMLGLAGVPVFLIPRFRPDTVLDAIEARRATVYMGVPAMYRLMREAGARDRDLTSVRVWISGADVMPHDLALEFKKMGATCTLPIVGSLGEAMFVEGYGMVEVGGGVAAKVSPPLLDLGLGESVGFVLPNYEMKVVGESGEQVPRGETGELWVKGPGLLREYWQDPEATRSAVTLDGWLRTGDLARTGPLGMVLFAGRKKDVIMRGGYSVYALEVQTALEDHPAVVEAAVLGLPDDRLGEVPVAAVRLTDAAAVDPDDLLAWAGEHLSEYKVPTRIVVVDDLPRTGTNKVQKRQLLPLFDD